MVNSQNGWPASPNKREIGVGYLGVEGVSIAGGVKAGPVATVLGYVARRFHHEVEALVSGWCWGWAWREVRGGGSISNHASGTAMDLNAPDHPLGKEGTFTPLEVRGIRSILAACDGVVRWGGDYAGRKDEMHFEIIGTAAAVRALADKIIIGEGALPIEREDDDTMIVAAMIGGKRTYGIYSGGVLTGLWAGDSPENASKRDPFWLTEAEWEELDRKSRLLIGEPGAAK